MLATLYKTFFLVFSLMLAFSANAADTTAPVAAPIRATDLHTQRQQLDQLREQMRELSRKMADLSQQMGDVGPRAYAWRYLGNPDRGMLGIVMSARNNGLHVDAVTPGGPAEKAGIRDGDVIVAIDAKPIDNTHGQNTRAPLAALKIGQTVKLTIQRDGSDKPLNFSVKAERREPFNFASAIGNPLPPDFDRNVRAQVEQAVRQAHVAQRAGDQARRAMQHFRFSSPWWGLNLVSLNSDLGAYFGADSGVLVLSADDDTFKGLKSGDVLLRVADHKIQRPEDALRALRDQPVGSTVSVHVLRQHKNLTLNVTAPDARNLFVPPPPPPPPPVPAAPPAPPARPAPALAPAPPVAPAPPPPLQGA